MKEPFTQQFQVKWSDVDPNMHMRGTVYMDFADNVRFAYMKSRGFGMKEFKELQVGPIIFNATINYLKEVYLNDLLTVNIHCDYLSEDHRKFGLSHEIFNEKNELVCKVKVDAAMLDLVRRKIIPCPEGFVAGLLEIMIPPPE